MTLLSVCIFVSPPNFFRFLCGPCHHRKVGDYFPRTSFFVMYFKAKQSPLFHSFVFITVYFLLLQFIFMLKFEPKQCDYSIYVSKA
jgi:hypothetical protein